MTSCLFGKVRIKSPGTLQGVVDFLTGTVSRVFFFSLKTT